MYLGCFGQGLHFISSMTLAILVSLMSEWCVSDNNICADDLTSTVSIHSVSLDTDSGRLQILNTMLLPWAK